MKYIIIEKNGLEVPVLFPCFWNHDDMLQQIGKAKIVSAGFAKRDNMGHLYVMGGSVSLKLKCRPIEDLDLILKQLDFEM